MSEYAATIQRLEERVARLEDELAVRRLVSAYGPAVDSGSADAAAGLWEEDGVYDSDASVWRGREEIAGMVKGEGHQGLIHRGAAHVIAAPYVRVAGDEAVATCYSRVYRRTDDGYEVWRLAVNRWELVRTPEGWRARYRTNRLIDGSSEPRQLLGKGLAG
ncbi:MAG TPA: nuclear transport factor 2 family protein [Acidimicrobiales bacterium]|nr:nuclear transport factor 2 family protein [Acidimicrobiales bacterium]